MQDLNKKNNLAAQEYWDEGYEKYAFSRVSENDPLRKWIRQYFSQTTNKSCFEFGCFPGRFLAEFGELGYKLNGIDLTPRVTDDLPEWFRENKFSTGDFSQINIFEYRTEKKFDVVCSFGLIEHFKNWEQLLVMHADLVANDGFVVVECPNFRGPVQYLIHRFFDHENLKRHYIPAMNPEKWKSVLEHRGFEIIYSGYFGNFDYWTDKPVTSFFGRMIFSVMNRFKKGAIGKDRNSSMWSPYIGIIAKKSGR